MPSLETYYDGDGEYLGIGWHTVQITNYRTFVPNSKNPGVEFEVVDTTDKLKSKTDGFYFHTEGSLKRLASFARACGLTREECARYNTDSGNSHAALVGKIVRVLVEKDGKYHKVTEWAEEDGSAMPQALAEKFERPQEQAAAPAADSIPF